MQKGKEILKLYGLDDIFNSIIFANLIIKALIAKAMDVNIMIDKKEVLIVLIKSIKTILFDSHKIGDLYKLV